MSARMSLKALLDALDGLMAYDCGATDSDGLGPQAHVEEDDLFLQVLRACANGDPDAPEMARIALCSREIEFDRWYE